MWTRPWTPPWSSAGPSRFCGTGGPWRPSPPSFGEAAQLREAHPELSLAQLAALCEPPVTKSSLSHRLRKLIQLSAQDTAP